MTCDRGRRGIWLALSVILLANWLRVAAWPRRRRHLFRMNGSSDAARTVRPPLLCRCTRPGFPIARKIGEAIALALLLQPQEHVLGENVAAEDLDKSTRCFSKPAISP